MTSSEYRVWLGGLLEGLAGRAIDPASLDGYVGRIVKNHPAAFGPVLRGMPTLAYCDGPEQEYVPEPEPEEGDTPPQMTLADIQALKRQKAPAKVRRPPARAVNTTPVVKSQDDVPQAADDGSGVVRMG